MEGRISDALVKLPPDDPLVIEALEAAPVAPAPPSLWQHPVAMEVNGRLIGLLLCRVSTPRRPMSTGHVKGLRVLAATAAAALEASMLLEHLRRSN